MLTVPQLLRSTFTTPRHNSGTVSFKSVRKGSNRAGYPKVLAQAYSAETPQGKRKAAPAVHQCSLTALDKKKGFSGFVKVSCSCEYFTYYCEYALYKQGAADITYSNGDPPVDRNPSLTPSLCKHLFALLTGLKSGRL